MRKSVLSPLATEQRPSLDASLDLEQLASVEISSEDPAHPFENALHGEQTDGWRAATPGRQTIRLQFDEPRAIHRIHLEFREPHRERSQEFSLSATMANQHRQEIVRQQWTFSPNGSTTEVEDYTVHLPDVSVLELTIDPGRHDQQAIASLQNLAIA